MFFLSHLVETTIACITSYAKPHARTITNTVEEARMMLAVSRMVVGRKYVAAEGLFETPMHRWMGTSWRTGAINTAF